MYVRSGLSHTRLDNIYKNMICRCYKASATSYKRYGAKGIKVCDEWKNNKSKFFEWAFKNGYSEELTLDRIDVSNGYSPDNCRWATYKEQANNTSKTIFLTFNGCKKSLHEWADYLGLKPATIWARLQRGDCVERALRV